LRYETFIVIGIIVAVLSFLNVIEITNIPSDFFWTLAGLGLVIEGFIERYK
jgi:hypothetical protein